MTTARKIKPLRGQDISTTEGMMKAWQEAGAMKPGEAEALFKARSQEGTLAEMWRTFSTEWWAKQNAQKKPDVGELSKRMGLEELRKTSPDEAALLEALLRSLGVNNNDS